MCVARKGYLAYGPIVTQWEEDFLLLDHYLSQDLKILQGLA